MDDDTGHAPTKKDLLERLLDKGMVMVHLDARASGVDVPERFLGEGDLRLNLSYKFQAGDLSVDHEQVRATLSFAGSPHLCLLPMSSIFAMVSHATGETFFFPGDAPPEALAALATVVRQAEEADESGEADGAEAPPVAPIPPFDGPFDGPPTPARPFLRAVPGGLGEDAPEADDGPDEAETEEADEAETAPDTERRPPYLRVVK